MGRFQQDFTIIRLFYFPDPLSINSRLSLGPSLQVCRLVLLAILQQPALQHEMVSWYYLFIDETTKEGILISLLASLFLTSISLQCFFSNIIAQITADEVHRKIFKESLNNTNYGTFDKSSKAWYKRSSLISLSASVESHKI